jgi:hypothetical protein
VQQEGRHPEPPEPESFLLFGAGLVVISLARRKRR